MAKFNLDYFKGDSGKSYTDGSVEQEILVKIRDGKSEEEILSEADQMEEFLFLGLRLMEGITEESFFKKFHRSLMQVYGEVIRRNECDGLLEYREGRLRLTGRGIDISNYVLAQFLF